MRLSDFDYALPKERIALYPPAQRTDARLLSVDKPSDKISHHVFREIGSLLRPGDVLVLNDTKVLPARLFAKKETGGAVEILLLKEFGPSQWKVLIRPSGRVKKGSRLHIDSRGDVLDAVVLDDSVEGTVERKIEFQQDDARKKIETMGHMPLPPYIQRSDEECDRDQYQTVFAAKEGAIASPTAGLHFDQRLLEDLKRQGIEIIYVTLHVSYSTFRPIHVEDLSQYQMFEEEYEVTPEAAAGLNRAMDQGRRVIACGTTSVRVLESSVDATGKIRPQASTTRLFVYPPYEFKVVKGIITNFHLPKSTLLLLVAAFLGGREPLFKVYEEAIRERYRFYSYGDAMLIV
ncbi:MAG: tRNA preQ1(34) S-adenosylmethionine ribosyltransferase-isomerase QueA [Candidatus Omnitrophica bacterium]|nr:tRNA preQ1(34) S-adenosylmethionine ribosyltransferase-isomerase QueA [Candidatus Omnitrophota bacterium]